MGFWRPGALRGFRALERSAMAATAAILRRVLVDDGQGGQTETYVVAAGLSAVPCRLRAEPLQPDEREVGGRVSNLTTWRIDFPVGTDVRDTDRIQHADGRVFEVLGRDGPQTWEATMRVRARLVS